MQHRRPLIVVLLLLSSLCKVSATVTVGSKRKCFLTNKELRVAVKNYWAGGKKIKAATIAKYGSPIGDWCVGKITDFSYVFAGDGSFEPFKFNEPLTNWDTSKATTMSGMFQYATKFNKPLNSWKVGKVTDMSDMFSFADSFNQPLDSWNVGQVTDMWGMFARAYSFNQPLDSWNVSQVTRMSEMFYYADSFNKPLNSWNVSQVTDMWGMFEGARSFNQPLNRWNVSRVTVMSAMFDYAIDFNQPLNRWNVSQVTDMSGMFSYAHSFNQPLDSWNVSQVTLMDYMFHVATDFNQNLCLWGTKLMPYCNVDGMFDTTNCRFMDQPDLFQYPPGPFCRKCITGTTLRNGTELTGVRAANDDVLVFTLEDNVEAGHKVTCELEVPNGDANLFVKFGSVPNVSTARDYDCASITFGPYDEDCTTEKPAPTNTTAYIVVLATQDSYSMTLSCFINDMHCLEKDQPCNQTEDCCGTMVCDGNETVANHCVPCGKPQPCGDSTARCGKNNKACRSAGQCCRRYTCDGSNCRKKG